MTDHELTVLESGSRKKTVGPDGTTKETSQFKQEQFIEAGCSCVEGFVSKDRAYEHLDEADTE